MWYILEVLIDLYDLEDFAVSILGRRPWNMDMDERRLIQADCVRSKDSFAVHDNVLEKHGGVLEWKAMGRYGTV